MARIVLPFSALLLLATCTLATAEDGFRLRSLNPFHQEEEAAPTPAGPQVIGVPTYREYTPPEEPTLLERLGDGTRSTFGRVSEAVRAPFTPQPIERTASRDGWFRLPWSQPPQPEEHEDVNDFLSRPIPQY